MDVTDALLPLAGVIIGGLITWFTGSADYRRQRRDDQRDALLAAADEFLQASHALQRAGGPIDLTALNRRYEAGKPSPEGDARSERIRHERVARARVRLLGTERVRKAVDKAPTRTPTA